MDSPTNETAARPIVGVVGLGTMGFSIAACLLMHGYPTIALATNEDEARTAPERLRIYLRELECEENIRLLQMSTDYAALADCEIVTESVMEDLQIKREVIAHIENAVSPQALIASNTSGLPISQLQENAIHPERILGMHWALPAPQSKLMEVICGDHTSAACAERALQFARCWKKDAALIRKDVPGLVSNRIMYAMIREACHLVESGAVTAADVDTILRHDMGTWVGFGGIFRFMDLTGGKLYATVMESLLPHLSNARELPAMMRNLQQEDAQGTANGHGFFDYTPETAREWDEDYLHFAAEAAALTEKYFSRKKGH